MIMGEAASTLPAGMISVTIGIRASVVAEHATLAVIL